MPRNSSKPFLTIVLAGYLMFLGVTAKADDPPPQWMRQAAAAAVPAYDKDVSAVVLHNEEVVTLGTDGKLITVENYAVKLLNRDGRKYAVAGAFYLASTGKVRSLDAWIIRADGTTKSFEKSSIVDIISDPDDVYNEGRVKMIRAVDEVDTGYVFGYSVVSEDLPLFYQDKWQFQDNLPTILSRYSLNLPKGWKASSITFNASEVIPSVSGSSYTWEIRGLKNIPIEPLSPAVENLAPRIVINYSPDDPSQAVNRVFANWLEVSRWATALYEPQLIVDEQVSSKARELTATAKTELEKIQAIGTYVQNLQYISIDIGVGYGNGMKPRPSNQVLNRGYGDCKDKANLMRAMLKSLGIDAFPVVIYSGDPTFVREEWASPYQFNHCIIAVKVSSGTIVPTVFEDSKLGRLLIFDATDPYTPVGDLPDYLQGSNALIIAGENGGLRKMPLLPPETDLLERDIKVTLTSSGAISGKIRETATGQSSTYFRREQRSLSAADYRKTIEGWLTRGATGAQLVNLSSNDKQSDAAFDLEVEFSAQRYGQLMQGRLLVFKPVIVGRRNVMFLTEQKRTNPIELGSNAMKETVTFELPAGFAVDEIPDPVDLKTNFGTYSTKYEHKDNKLVFTRTITTKRSLIEAAKYSGVKDFYSKILEAEQSPVVLVKK